MVLALRRRNVTTSMIGLKSGRMRKNLTQGGNPRYSWGTQKKEKHGYCLHLAAPADET